MEGFFNNVAPVETEVVVAQGKKKNASSKRKKTRRMKNGKPRKKLVFIVLAQSNGS